MSFHSLAVRYVGPFYSAVHTLPRICSEPSSYPEQKRKCWIRRYLELVWERVYRQNTNRFYNAYGFDVDYRNAARNYVDENVFWNKIVLQNYVGRNDHTIILRDKLLFAVYMQAFGIASAQVLANVKRGHYYFAQQEVSFDDWVRRISTIQKPFFLKEDTACCGHNVYKLQWSGSGFVDADGKPFVVDARRFDGADYIVQECISNHASVDAIYPKSLNTARLITAWDDSINAPRLFTQFYRVGANNNAVDNWAVGGILFSLDECGEIGELGFYKTLEYAKEAGADAGGLCVKRHPATGFVFKGFRLPDYDAALQLVLRAHALLPSVKSIGWDVAFTPEGPLLIKGNDDWEIAPSQIVNGGLRKSAEETFGI